MAENKILENLKVLMKGKTTIIISHRVSNARLADQIIVLDQGEIIEKGSHDELLENGGSYKELYDRQLMKDEVL